MIVLGIIILVTGLVFDIFGAIDFFSGNVETFWYFFVGFPLLFIGGVLIMMASIGTFARFHASQVTPVVTDIANDMLEGTRDELGKTIAQVGKQKVKCIYCRTENPIEAKYCQSCGRPLEKICPHCGQRIGTEARFCQNCGHEIN